MKKNHLLFALLMLSSTLIFAQNKVSFGLSSEYSANYMKKSIYRLDDYSHFSYMKFGLSGLYEPFKKNFIGLKTTLNYKKYRLISDYSNALIDDEDTKRNLHYLEFNVALLIHFANPKHGLTVDYSIEKYLSQNYKGGDWASPWSFYEDTHQVLGLGFYYFPIPELQFTLKAHQSLKPFGIDPINMGEVIRDNQKFLVYGVGLSASYYFNRKKKAKRQE